MKTRHATALALVGWYLMVPPERCENKTRNDIDTCDRVPNLEAPLSAWFRTWPTYPTAQDCESAIDDSRHTFSQAPVDRVLEAREVAAERCVSSDALKGTTAGGRD